MGFASGSGIAQDIWDGAKNLIPKENKALFAKVLIDVLEDYDCDTMEECDFVEEWLNYNEDTYEYEIKEA